MTDVETISPFSKFIEEFAQTQLGINNPLGRQGRLGRHEQRITMNKPVVEFDEIVEIIHFCVENRLEFRVENGTKNIYVRFFKLEG